MPIRCPSFRVIAGEFIDLIAPPRCAGCDELSREVFCEKCAPQVERIEGPYCPRCGHPHPPSAHGWPICQECRERKRPKLDGARSVGFHHGPLREAIIEFKFHNRRHLAEPLGAMLARRLDNEYARPKKLPLDDIEAIVPVVLHPIRRRSRGYDQAVLLARELAKLCGKPMWDDVIERVKDTRPRIGLTPNERAEDMRGAFEPRKTWKVKGACLLLVDDVYTTGSTLREAAKALKSGGAKSVYGLSVTRAVPDWHPKSFTRIEG